MFRSTAIAPRVFPPSARGAVLRQVEVAGGHPVPAAAAVRVLNFDLAGLLGRGFPPPRFREQADQFLATNQVAQGPPPVATVGELEQPFGTRVGEDHLVELVDGEHRFVQAGQDFGHLPTFQRQAAATDFGSGACVFVFPQFFGDGPQELLQPPDGGPPEIVVRQGGPRFGRVAGEEVLDVGLADPVDVAEHFLPSPRDAAGHQPDGRGGQADSPGQSGDSGGQAGRVQPPSDQPAPCHADRCDDQQRVETSGVVQVQSHQPVPGVWGCSRTWKAACKNPVAALARVRGIAYPRSATQLR